MKGCITFYLVDSKLRAQDAKLRHKVQMWEEREEELCSRARTTYRRLPNVSVHNVEARLLALLASHARRGEQVYIEIEFNDWAGRDKSLETLDSMIHDNLRASLGSFEINVVEIHPSPLASY